MGVPTILHLADSRLDIIQAQVADLLFQTVEIHGADSALCGVFALLNRQTFEKQKKERKKD
jgi:hypothetical protein